MSADYEAEWMQSNIPTMFHDGDGDHLGTMQYFYPNITMSAESENVMWFAVAGMSDYEYSADSSIIPLDIDLWMAKSTDNGLHWSEAENVTNTPTTGALTTFGYPSGAALESGVHLANQGMDESVGVFYQMMDPNVNTIPDNGGYEDYKNWIYVGIYGVDGSMDPIITMTPEDGDEFTIGSSGGSFGFNALLVNSTDETKFYEAYLWAQLPNENWYGPIAPTPVTVRVRPGRQVSVNLNQRVPGGAPDGWYYFSGEIYLDGDLADEDGFYFWKGDPQSRGTEPISGNQELVARTRANVISDADDSEWRSFYDEYGVEAKRGDVWTDEGLYHEDGVAISVLQLSAVALPNQYQLHQNYPNPFNPTTMIRYDLPEDALVNITIYDLMGHSVRSLVNSRQTAGYRSIQWDATNNLGEPISAGMYIYTIQAGEFRQTKKMVLLK
jgi:hypothetical protein